MFLPKSSMRAVGVLIVTGGWLAGCASSSSVSELPLLQETLEGRCVRNELKECVVWGGNRFAKRYEYCGCRRL